MRLVGDSQLSLVPDSLSRAMSIAGARMTKSGENEEEERAAQALFPDWHSRVFRDVQTSK